MACEPKLTTWMSIWMWPTFLVKVPRGPVTVMVRAFETTVTPSGMTRDSTEEMSFIFLGLRGGGKWRFCIDRPYLVVRDSV
jgi:hypothetical protein